MVTLYRTNEREESVVKQHSLFRKMLYRPKHVVSLVEYNIFLNWLCCLTTISSLSLVTHTTGMTHLKVIQDIATAQPTQ